MFDPTSVPQQRCDINVTNVPSYKAARTQLSEAVYMLLAVKRGLVVQRTGTSRSDRCSNGTIRLSGSQVPGKLQHLMC